MKKLIIVLEGGSKMLPSPKVGDFVRVPGHKGLIWKRKFLDIEEFNAVADKVFASVRSLRIPEVHYISVRVVDEGTGSDDISFIGEDLLPELELLEGESKQDVLRTICDEQYNGSVVDWNNLPEIDKRKIINKACDQPESEKKAPPVAVEGKVEPVAVEETPVTTAEAPAPPEKIGKQVMKDLEKMHWKKFEAKYGHKKDAYKKLYNIG